MGTILQPVYSASDPLAPIESLSSRANGHTAGCHGMSYTVLLVVPSALFAIYLAISAVKNMKKLFLGRSFIMISYYALLWITTVLNLAWCSLQVSFFGCFSLSSLSSKCGGVEDFKELYFAFN